MSSSILLNLLFTQLACTGEENQPDDSTPSTNDTGVKTDLDSDGDTIADEDDCAPDDQTRFQSLDYFVDNDSDGFGIGDLISDCFGVEGLPEHTIEIPGDCDDNDPTTNPDTPEICDGIDNDCDGLIDNAASGQTNWYFDADRDGYGDPNIMQSACTASQAGSELYVNNGEDCNDSNPTVNPGETETCNDTDDNCDGAIDEDLPLNNFYADSDNDGYGDEDVAISTCEESYAGYTADATDCDDESATTNTAAVEVCDGEDNDCSGIEDDDAVDTTTFYADADGDGYGDATSSQESCSATGNFTVADASLATDCDDTDATSFPGATETADDGIDQDCDGRDFTPDTCTTSTFYYDDDGDGYGDSSVAESACTASAGFVANAEDCDDASADISPAATEECDGLDNDCDGDTDDDDTNLDLNTATTWYYDGDGDTFGTSSTYTEACAVPASYVADSTDFNDESSAAYPGATEICDEIDNDGDSSTDEGVTTTYYRDSDSDGYGNSSSSTAACSLPTGYTTNATDCNDSSSAISPAGTEICDASNTDEDCDGTADDADSSASGKSTVYADSDGDGYGSTTSAAYCDVPATGYATNSSDCDDSSSAISPAATEICDASDTDEDCDGLSDDDDSSATGQSTVYTDADGDGYGSTTTASYCNVPATGYATSSTDCDDGSSSTYPGASETCDSSDNDCDGSTDEGVTTTYYLDSDGDGYGTSATTTEACSVPSGYAAATSVFDCDDGESTTNPGESEVCDDGVDNDCSGDAPECVLSDISLSSADLRFRTTVNEAALGSAIAGAGDLDADGYDDYLIAGPDLSLTTAGKVNVAYGAADGYDTAYALTGDSTGDLAGYDVAGGCDWNADGTPDVAISSPYDDDGGSNAGAVYIVEGPVTAASTLGSVAVSKFTGESDDDFVGTAVSLGDFDNNGNCDIVIGAGSYADSGSYSGYGAVYVVNGSTSTMSLASADAFIEGSSAYDKAGYAVSTGDVDGDGTDDMALGAYDNRDNGSIADPLNPAFSVAGAGKASIFLGPVSGSLSVDDGDTIVLGEAAGDRLGMSMDMNGDVDDDGYDDLIVGAYYESSVDDMNGAVYLLNGPLSAAIDLSTTSADAKFIGEYEGNFVGSSVAFVDSNGDLYSDILIGATSSASSSATLTAGASHLFYGDIVGSFNISDADATFTGESSEDYAGVKVAGIGDANGDDFEDFMIGATGYDYTGTDNGVAYGIFGTGM